jgi:cytoskeletal protein CcmA (bactofilin family)
MIKQRMKFLNSKEDGAALLVVLFIIMAITILSLGFMSRSDVELACGENMILRTQMDYLAESGLEHAKGLILNPQDVASEYWSGASAQQLAAGSADYYDLTVVRDDSDPADHCNYTIDCNSYRMKDGQEIGRSSLSAQLRLDPCIALWMGSTTVTWPGVRINGDVYCNGTLENKGVINGDVFAGALTGSIAGRHKATTDLSLVWPRVTVADFTSRYSTVTISSGSLSGVTLGPYSPPQVCYRIADLSLNGDVQINGMLVVSGDLTIQGGRNIIVAPKNMPALLVTGNLKIEGSGDLDISGLAVVDGNVLIGAGDAHLDVLGGLFIRGVLAETTMDSSGNANTGILYNGPTWRPAGGWTAGALEFDGIDDKVEDPDAANYLNGLSAITVSVWVKSDVTFQDRGILFTRDQTTSDVELGIRYDKDGAYGGGVSGIKASIRTTAGFTQIESSSYVQTKNWQHLALVWKSDPNDSGLRLYINGLLNPLRYDMGRVFGTVSGVQKLMLGRDTKGTYWDGLIDDLRIYNRALNVSEIYPPTDGVAGLIAHWRLDGQSSNVTITTAPEKTAILHWSEQGVDQKWGQAAGAFFRSIRRN